MATTEKRKIEYVKVEKLRHYERNTRTHNDAQLNQIIASINEFGFTNPVLIDENNILIAGHGRTTAAQMMGLKEVPAIRLSGLTGSQKKALRIADNKLALNAGWDEELLKLELGDLQELDYDLDLVGFELEEIDAILQDLEFEDVFIVKPDKQQTPAPRPEYTQDNNIHSAQTNSTGRIETLQNYIENEERAPDKFVVKLMFNDFNGVNRFMDEYKDILENAFDCDISFIGTENK